MTISSLQGLAALVRSGQLHSGTQHNTPTADVDPPPFLLACLPECQWVWGTWWWNHAQLQWCWGSGGSVAAWLCEMMQWSQQPPSRHEQRLTPHQPRWPAIWVSVCESMFDYNFETKRQTVKGTSLEQRNHIWIHVRQTVNGDVKLNTNT